MNLACNTVCVDNGWCLPTASFEKVPGLRTDHALWWPFILETPPWCRYGQYLSFAHETKHWKRDWAAGNYQHHTRLTSGWTGIWTQNVELKSMTSCDFMTTARLVHRNHYSYHRTKKCSNSPKVTQPIVKVKMNLNLFCIEGQLHQRWGSKLKAVPFNSRPSQQREKHRDNHQRMQDEPDCTSIPVLSLTGLCMLLTFAVHERGNSWWFLNTFEALSTGDSHDIAPLRKAPSVCSDPGALFHLFRLAYGLHLPALLWTPQTPPFSRATMQLILPSTKTMHTPHTRTKHVAFEGMFCLQRHPLCLSLHTGQSEWNHWAIYGSHLS